MWPGRGQSCHPQRALIATCAWALHVPGRWLAASLALDLVVDVIRKTLLDRDSLQIGLFEARPRSDACGDVERQDASVVVLPSAAYFRGTMRLAGT